MDGGNPITGHGLAVAIEDVSKRFGHVEAVKDVSLHAAPGELVSLLGPSGCGKTTMLRMIAGLERPDRGRIMIGGMLMNDVPIWRRGIGMVFQNYALFPHMTVFQNIAFGLRMQRVPKAAMQRGVRDAMDLVHLGGMQDRLPSQLSGGQRQRVALARALVNNPRILLLDEPLGALDRKLREQMQVELKLLQRRVGVSTIMVTHDQEEALTLSDRVVVMQGGCVVQSGTPDQIYERPASRFVADFIGMSNLLSGVIASVARDGVSIRLDSGATVVAENDGAGRREGERVEAVIRPETIGIGAGCDGAVNRLSGVIAHVVYSGAVTYCYVDVGLDNPLVALVPNDARHAANRLAAGRDVVIGWEPSSLTVLASAADPGVSP
ncbi:MAG: ABC transporter ATP-binding protein [Acetobacteraceae bacterium]